MKRKPNFIAFKMSVQNFFMLIEKSLGLKKHENLRMSSEKLNIEENYTFQAAM